MIAKALSSRNATAALFDGVEITSDTLTGRGGSPPRRKRARAKEKTTI